MLALANIFQPLIDVFQSILVFFHNGGITWGWSIVLLTICMRALLIPLTFKQFHSMQRMQAHMPELKRIQAKYKQDKQRQQEEVMKFYRENKVNPFSSCLPLAAQLPVFISLYYMLRQSLRHDICPKLNPVHAAHTVACGATGHASFLFVHDLTATATGATLVGLIILYVGSQLGSSLLTMLTSPQAMEKNQRILMLVMPLIFVAFVVRFPAGLLVYWITTNLWTILQGYVMRRMLGPAPVVATAGADAGALAGVGTNGSSHNGDTAGEGQGIAGLIARARLRPGGRDESPAAPEPGAVKAEGRKKSEASSSVATRSRPARGAPPPPPKKKKKRSGRRR